MGIETEWNDLYRERLPDCMDGDRWLRRHVDNDQRPPGYVVMDREGNVSRMAEPRVTTRNTTGKRADDVEAFGACPW